MPRQAVGTQSPRVAVRLCSLFDYGRRVAAMATAIDPPGREVGEPGAGSGGLGVGGEKCFVVQSGGEFLDVEGTTKSGA